MKVIGLTGGIGSGKSTVSKYISSKGYKIIDADMIAREIVEIGTDGYDEIVENFGLSILKDDKSLDRKKLGKIIFNNFEKRELLNRITHPKIDQKFRERVQYYEKIGKNVVFYDNPLLFEMNLSFKFYKIVVVYAEKEILIKRVAKRDNIDQEYAIKKVETQIDIEKKKGLGDIIIDNSKSLLYTYKQIDSFLEFLKGNYEK